jgi:hypothetical protein
MGTVDLPKSPSAYHAAAPSPYKPAGGFRDAPSHEDLQQAVTRILEEETENILRYLMGKLPPQALDSLDSRGSLKGKLYSSINRHYQELFNRYAASDDHDETTAFLRHTSGEIAELLRSLGGAGKINTGEIEKAAGNRRGINDLEIHTNNILRQKADTGMFLSQDIGSIVKCVFRDNALRPKTVTDVKLAVNIPDSELIGPVFYSLAAAKYLIKEFISRHIIESIDRGISGSADQDIEELIGGILSETAGFNLSNVRENVRKSADIETIRTCGFTLAVNALVAILDNSKLSYQFIENTRNGRELILREYEDNDPANLPDEHYEIQLWYFDRDRLVEDRKAYDAQIKSFEQEVQHLWNLMEVLYRDSKSVFKVNDFEDLAKKNKGRIRDLIKRKSGEGLYEVSEEISGEKGNIRAKLARMHERIKNMYEFLYPIERRVMEDRLARLEGEYSRLDFMINPHHLQSGLLIDVEITSIKRKKTTLDSLAAALREFFPCVYGVFQNAAFTAFGDQAPAAQPEKSPRKPRGGGKAQP